MGVLNNLAIAILGLAVTSSHREVPDYCRVIDDAMAAVAREAMGVGLNVLTTAPPRHDQLREIVAPPFMPRALEAIEQRAAVLISAIFDRLGNRDEAAFQRPYAFDVTRIPVSAMAPARISAWVGHSPRSKCGSPWSNCSRVTMALKLPAL